MARYRSNKKADPTRSHFAERLLPPTFGCRAPHVRPSMWHRDKRSGPAAPFSPDMRPQVCQESSQTYAGVHRTLSLTSTLVRPTCPLNSKTPFPAGFAPYMGNLSVGEVLKGTPEGCMLAFKECSVHGRTPSFSRAGAMGSHHHVHAPDPA